MSPVELTVIVAVVCYAVFQQTRRHQLHKGSRFKLAVIYGIVGLSVGGTHLPQTVLAVAFLALSLALSLGVGVARGRLTSVWREGDIEFSQGTQLTVTLFLLMIAAKFALGTIAYLAHASQDGGVGEILLMLAIMMAIQAQLISKRAEALRGTSGQISNHVEVQHTRVVDHR
jgi:hypothetical protein